MTNDLFDTIKGIVVEVFGRMAANLPGFELAIVTSVTPLRIAMENTPSPSGAPSPTLPELVDAQLPYSPSCTVPLAWLSPTDRVLCLKQSKRWMIIGRIGGDSAHVGTVRLWAGALGGIPDDCLLCDGSAFAPAIYPKLASIWQPWWGGTAGAPRVPDFGGKTIVGYDAGDPDFDDVGATGGEKVHTLTVGEMPSHTHTQNPHTHTEYNVTTGNADEIPWLVGASGSTYRSRQQFTTGSATATNNAATAVNQSTGGGSAHNNLQPYRVLPYIIQAR